MGSEDTGCGDEFLIVERKGQEGISWWKETQASWVYQGKEGRREEGDEGH